MKRIILTAFAALSLFGCSSMSADTPNDPNNSSGEARAARQAKMHEQAGTPQTK